MSVAVSARAEAPSPTEVGAIPRDYNFAADILGRNLKAGRADKPAYIDPRGAWTYGQLADRVARFAAGLRTLGLRREERVLICLADTIDWPTAFLGCLKAGVVAVPVNTLMTEDDYRFMLADSRARTLVVSEGLYPRFQKLIGAAADLEHVIVSGDDAHGHRRFEDIIEQAKPDPATAPTVRDDIAFWLYTSGSTGKPKGAVHVHSDLRLTDELYGRPVLGISENDVCYSVAKLFFAYGLGNALTFPLSAGACTVLLPDRPTPDGVAALLRKYPITVFYAVPTFYAAFLASPNAPQRAELKLRCSVSAGEALPTDIGRRWVERNGLGLALTAENTHFLLLHARHARIDDSGDPRSIRRGCERTEAHAVGDISGRLPRRQLPEIVAATKEDARRRRKCRSGGEQRLDRCRDRRLCGGGHVKGCRRPNLRRRSTWD